MAALPDTIRDYVETHLLPSRQPAFLAFDSAGKLIEFGGALELYRLANLSTGRSADDVAPFLSGMLPATAEPIVLESVEVYEGRFADVHVIAGGVRNWALLLDCSEAMQLKRTLQQRGYDLSLLHDQLTKQNASLEEANKRIAAEQAKADELLLNILPRPIAERLKRGERPIADPIDEATVLLAEVTGFSRLTAALPPTRQIAVLNQIFSLFDSLAAELGLEKIKTMGDVYLVAGGLPVARPDHAAAVVELALRMQNDLVSIDAGVGEPFTLRAGIATGPMLAGVIGTSRFTYDVWGETVDAAAAMQGSAPPGSVQVTESVYRELGDRYLFQERGVYYLKGDREVITYLLNGRREPAASASAAR